MAGRSRGRGFSPRIARVFARNQVRNELTAEEVLCSFPSKCLCDYFSLRGLGINSLAYNDERTGCSSLIQYPSFIPTLNGQGPTNAVSKLRDPQWSQTIGIHSSQMGPIHSLVQKNNQSVLKPPPHATQ